MAWLDLHLVTITAEYFLGKKNVLAYQMSYVNQVLPSEWSLLPWVFDTTCEVHFCSHLNFFITRASIKLSCVSSFRSLGMGTKCFSASMG